MKSGRFDINGLFSRGAQELTRIGADISTGKLSGKSISDGLKIGSALLRNLRNVLNNFHSNLEKLSSQVKYFSPGTIRKPMESAFIAIRKLDMELQNQLRRMPTMQSPKSHAAPESRQKTRKEGMQRENLKSLLNTNNSPSPASSEKNELRDILPQLKRDISSGERRAPAELRELFKRHNEQHKTPQAQSAKPQQLQKSKTMPSKSSSSPANNQTTIQRANTLNARIGRVTELQAKGSNLSGPESRREAREEKIQPEPRETPKEQFRPSADTPESFRIANPSNGGHAPRWDKEAVRKEEKRTRILEDSGDPNMSWDDVKQFLGNRAKAQHELDAAVAQQDAARSLARKQALGNSGVRFQEQTRLLARLDKIANELNTKLNPDHPDYDLLADSHNRRGTLEKDQKNIEAKLKELEEWPQSNAN